MPIPFKPGGQLTVARSKSQKKMKNSNDEDGRGGGNPSAPRLLKRKISIHQPAGL